MERGSSGLEEAKEEVKSRARHLYDFTWQMASFGPFLASKMSIYSAISLPWGLGAAGAETVKQGVDSGNADGDSSRPRSVIGLSAVANYCCRRAKRPQNRNGRVEHKLLRTYLLKGGDKGYKHCMQCNVGVARMTASMVKLGMLGTVHDIVVSLCAQDRADAVAAVTASLLGQGEVWTVMQITNALVASNHAGDAVAISGSLIQQGNTQILTVVKEAGLDLSMCGPNQHQDKKKEGGEGSSNHNAGVLGSIQEQTAKAFERITPDKKDEDEGRKKTPDADALFNEWTGVKPGEIGEVGGSGGKSQEEAVPPKEERLL